MFDIKTRKIIELVLSGIYLLQVILAVPLAFDMGGIECGLSFALTAFLIYFTLATLRLLTRRTNVFWAVTGVYYLQHVFLPSLLTFFLSYYSSRPAGLPMPPPVRLWRYFILNSTPVFTILEGFCSLLLIQAIGQTLAWLIEYKSDSWLFVSLVGSGAITTGALFFLYRIYLFPFTIDVVSASLLGSLLTLTAGLALFGIISKRGSMIESSLLFAYIVRCIYETFPALSEDASIAISSLFSLATTNIKNEVPRLPPQLTNTLLQVVPFLASNLPGSFKTIWEFFRTAMEKLTVPLLLNLAYRLGVFYAATKIIPSLYHNASQPSLSPLAQTPQLRSRETSSSSVSTLRDFPPRTPMPASSSLAALTNDTVSSNIERTPPARNRPFHLSRRRKPSTIVRLIYAYSPCIIVAVYTHLMMLYHGELGTELKLWGFWESSFEVVVHPWQFWNWVNMVTTLLLYTAELAGNSLNSGNTALTSHWKID